MSKNNQTYIEYDSEYNVDDFKKLYHPPIEHNCRGLYFLFQNNILLYIGYSVHLHERIKSHLRGETNTRRFYQKINSIKFIFDESIDNLREQLGLVGQCDIEYYLINKIKPKYNIKKY